MEKILNVKTNLEALVEVLNNSLDDGTNYKKRAIEFANHESGIDIEPVDNYDDFVKRTTTDLKGLLNIEDGITLDDLYVMIFDLLHSGFPAIPIESTYVLTTIIMDSLWPAELTEGDDEDERPKETKSKFDYDTLEYCLMSAMKNDQRKSILKKMLDEVKGDNKDEEE